MTTPTDIQKIVNANQNLRFSWVHDPVYSGYVAHITTANWIIEKHCMQGWKNHPETADYQLMQLAICMELSGSRGSRGSTLTFISDRIKCHPLTLINDTSPELKDIK